MLRPYQVVAGCILTVMLLSLPGHASEQSIDFDQVRDQGVLYFKRGLFKQARLQLQMAHKAPQGIEDFVTLYYLSAASFELLLLEDAFKYAYAAKQHTGDNTRHSARLKELLDEMRSLYGAVLIEPAEGENRRSGRIFLKATTGMINKQKRERFEGIQRRYSQQNARIPAKVYLPYGSYLANNVAFVLEEGVPAPTIRVYLRQVDDVAERSNEGGFPILGVSLGAAAATALGVGAVLLLGEEESTPAQNRHPVRFRQEPVAP